MKIANKLKRVLTGFLTGSMLLTSVGALPTVSKASAAGACTVNTNKTYQTIRGFGGMNLPEWQGYDLTDSQIQTVFGNGQGQLGLTVLRIYVSDDKNSWSRAIPTAKAAQKLGATVFATPWNPPSSMRTNGSGGRTGGKYVLKNGAEAQYAQHLNSYIKYMEGQGINLYSVSVQNEPDCSSDWTHWSPDRCASFIANYGKAVKEGTHAKLMSPESFQYSNESTGFGKMYYKKIVQNQAAMANLDLFGTHFYGTQRSQMDYPTVENSGKEVWMTEVYVPNSDTNSANRYPEAIKVAENIHNGLVVGNMSAYVWWYIRRSYSLIGQDDGKPTKRGYMMAQYSKWVRPGDVRIDATEQPNSNILVSAYKHSDTQATVVAINKGSSAVSQQFNISGRSVKSVDTYRTSGSENIAKVSSPSASGSSFTAQLPANSVSTFVVTMNSDGSGFTGGEDPKPAEPIKPDNNGYYYHDTFENGTDNWEGRGDATVSAGGTAYAGSKALTVSGRTKAWHGAQKTLDAATFKAGDSYSFSIAASGSDNMMLSLVYKDSAGETKYDHIADGCSTGGYVQLANQNYKLPEGSGYTLYVETEEGTDNFTIDEAIVAKAGTQIDGPKPVTTTTTTTTTSTTTTTTTSTTTATSTTTSATTSTTVATTTVEPEPIKAGDANGDGNIDMSDVVLIMQALSNPNKFGVDGTDPKHMTSAGVRNADTDGDGLTVNDALRIQQYLLGKLDSLAS